MVNMAALLTLDNVRVPEGDLHKLVDLYIPGLFVVSQEIQTSTFPLYTVNLPVMSPSEASFDCGTFCERSVEKV